MERKIKVTADNAAVCINQICITSNERSVNALQRHQTANLIATEF